MSGGWLPRFAALAGSPVAEDRAGTRHGPRADGAGDGRKNRARGFFRAVEKRGGKMSKIPWFYMVVL